MTTEPGDVKIDVYDSSFAWQGEVSEFASLHATRRWLDLSTADFTAPSDLDLRPALADAGAHVVVSHKGSQHVAGWVMSDAGTLLPTDAIEYRVEGYWNLLRMVLGWPVPGAALTAQTVAYWTHATGAAPAETVLKAALSANLSRLGLSWVTVATDLGRGSNVDPSLRFHPIEDRFLTALKTSGLDVVFELVEGEGVSIDVREQVTHTVPLSAESGEIESGKWVRERPRASRGVGASTGEAEARTFFGPVVDTAREAEYGFCGELVVDARDTDDSATVLARIDQALAEAGPKVSVSLTLAETEDFTYPEVFEVGDVVPLDLTDDVSSTDVIDAVELSATTGDGYVVTPHVGDLPDEPNTLLLRATRRIAAGLRDERMR